jgi:hypothetical protein
MVKRDSNKRDIMLIVTVLINIFCVNFIFIYDKILFSSKSPKMIKLLNQTNQSNVDTIDKLWFYKKQLPSALIIGTRKSGKIF